jgi:hypothetical protein
MENSKKVAIGMMTDMARLEMDADFAADLVRQDLNLECDALTTSFVVDCEALPQVNFSPAGSTKLKPSRRL